MASNAYGDCVVLTSFGESHGRAVGGVIDGFPAGFLVDLDAVQRCVEERRPGRSSFVSPRQETDHVEWLSGLLDGRTTGAPIAFLIRNQDARPEAYTQLNKLWRPGHAQWAYQQKYGLVDSSGGGRSSARETVVRVVAGALAELWLAQRGVIVGAELVQMGPLQAAAEAWPPLIEAQRSCARHRLERVRADPLFCGDQQSSAAMQSLMVDLAEQGDSVGAVVEGWVVGMPAGWGDPLARKLDAELAALCLSLPACKGFEVGCGFAAAQMRGSEHNDPFVYHQGSPQPASNSAGGLLGGISTGLPLVFRAAFKPTSSIRKEQMTCTREGTPCRMSTGAEGRHDPCVGIRAVPVVRSIAAWAVMNAALRHRLARSEMIEE
jgi:chorismate synthase